VVAVATIIKLAAIIVIAGSATAYAHSWYPKECCHDQDCHPVPCAELKIDRKHDSVVWKGLVWFGLHQVRSSLDGQCHVCAKSYTEFVPYVPLCVFVPDVTS
jgi:hypothetical protein